MQHFVDRLCFELRLAWKPLVFTPLIFLAPLTGLVALQYALKQSPAHVLLAAVEMALPMAAGVIVTTTISQDAALELQLTMPIAYRRTGMLRMVMVTLWGSLVSALALAVVASFHLLYLPTFAHAYPALAKVVLLQLIWLAPLLWLVSVGICLSLLTQSTAAGGAMLGGIWLLDILLVGIIAQTDWLYPALLFPATLVMFPATTVSRVDVVTYWLTTRIQLLEMAAGFLLIGWLLLHDTERLLKGATEE